MEYRKDNGEQLTPEQEAILRRYADNAALQEQLDIFADGARRATASDVTILICAREISAHVSATLMATRAHPDVTGGQSRILAMLMSSAQAMLRPGNSILIRDENGKLFDVHNQEVTR